MAMTDEQKYTEVIKALGELIKAKDERIFWLEYDLDALKEKLKQAEAQIDRNEEVEKKCIE